jgi:hypothetical protein
MLSRSDTRSCNLVARSVCERHQAVPRRTSWPTFWSPETRVMRLEASTERGAGSLRIREAVYRTAWSLFDLSGGSARRCPVAPPGSDRPRSNVAFAQRPRSPTLPYEAFARRSPASGNGNWAAPDLPINTAYEPSDLAICSVMVSIIFGKAGCSSASGWNRRRWGCAPRSLNPSTFPSADRW